MDSIAINKSSYAETTQANGRVLTGLDLILATVIALGMCTAFTVLSSGLSLIVTFVPGLVFTWLTFLWLYLNGKELPNASEFFPFFFATLGMQFLHFAEEFVTGFNASFPQLYGGAPYQENLFVTFNMVSYFVFTVSCLLVFTRQIRFLLIPATFFIVYGAIGNAISHTWWSFYLGSYFPGLVTAQLYWILGPMLLYKLSGSWRQVLAVTVGFAVVLVGLLTLFARPDLLGR